MNTIQISNHPVDDNIVREASYSGHEVSNDAEFGYFVKLRIRINHYIFVGEEKIEHPLQSSKWVTLTADRNSFVDAQGNLVPQEESVMSEFDFFIMLFDEKIKQSELIEAKILWADSEGRFN
jgi:hypothetical protein